MDVVPPCVLVLVSCPLHVHGCVDAAGVLGKVDVSTQSLIWPKTERVASLKTRQDELRCFPRLRPHPHPRPHPRPRPRPHPRPHPHPHPRPPLPEWLTGSAPGSYWQGEYVACLLSLLQLMTDVHFQHLMDNCQSQDELKVEALQKRPCRPRLLKERLCFLPSGAADEDLVCLQKPDEAQHLPPRLERHEAPHQQVRTLNGAGVGVSDGL